MSLGGLTYMSTLLAGDESELSEPEGTGAESKHRPIPKRLFYYLTIFHPTGAALWNKVDRSVEHVIRLIDFCLVHACDRYKYRVDDETEIARHFILSYWKKHGIIGNEAGLPELIDQRMVETSFERDRQLFWLTGKRQGDRRNQTAFSIRCALADSDHPLTAAEIAEKLGGASTSVAVRQQLSRMVKQHQIRRASRGRYSVDELQRSRTRLVLHAIEHYRTFRRDEFVVLLECSYFIGKLVPRQGKADDLIMYPVDYLYRHGEKKFLREYVRYRKVRWDGVVVADDGWWPDPDLSVLLEEISRTVGGRPISVRSAFAMVGLQGDHDVTNTDNREPS